MASSTSEQMESSSSMDVVVLFNRVLNSRSSYLASQYISDNVVMEWFGRTIVGRTSVLNFLFEEACVSNHDLIEVKQTKGLRPPYRALKRFRQPLTPEKEDDFGIDDSGFGSGLFESCDSSFSSSGSLTPSHKLPADMSRLYVSKHKDNRLSQMPLCPGTFKTPLNTRVPVLKRPLLKRQPMLLKCLKEVDLPKNLEFVDAAGIISFHVDGDCYNAGQSWSKPCHLQIGYQQPNAAENLTFCFLLYNNDMPCRRNLSQVFDQCE